MRTLVCIHPNGDADTEVKANTKDNSYDDGYEQSVGIGAFHVSNEVALTWTNAKYADATRILDFLRPGLRVERFIYAAPMEAPKVYKCMKLSYKWGRGRRCEIRATFKEQAG